MFIFAAAILFMSGCEEDARFAARTQYLGGIYGTAPTTGAPHDTVSYWDGDGIGGKPSIKISLGEQRAYFYKSGMLVGISQLSTGREGLNTPAGHFYRLRVGRVPNPDAAQQLALQLKNSEGFQTFVIRLDQPDVPGVH